jgi:uncharacterized cupin superfamily protein
MELVNEADLEWSETSRGETAFRRKQLGEAADSAALGCSLYELPAGEKSWPYHYHTANEEALYALSGTATLRLDGETHSLAAGDYVAFPPEERGAHRVVNDSDAVFRYLVVSTMTDPDVTVYPDSEKVGVFAGSPPGGREERTVHGYYRRDDDVGYWEDE